MGRKTDFESVNSGPNPLLVASLLQNRLTDRTSVSEAEYLSLNLNSAAIKSASSSDTKSAPFGAERPLEQSQPCRPYRQVAESQAPRLSLEVDSVTNYIGDQK